MRALVIDTETTGLDPKDSDIIEVGAALFDTTSRQVLWAYGSLVFTETKNAAEFVNGIEQPLIEAARDLPDARNVVASLVESVKIDILMAHNADFDRKFIEQKWGVMVKPGTKDRIPWVCTQKDIVYPNAKNSQNLSHLAVDHGIPIGILHRALNDVLLTIELLKKAPDLEHQIQIALGPRKIFEALVPYQQRNEAKSRGFNWNAGDKRWEKKMPADTPLEPTPERPFRIKIVG